MSPHQNSQKIQHFSQRLTIISLSLQVRILESFLIKKDEYTPNMKENETKRDYFFFFFVENPNYFNTHRH